MQKISIVIPTHNRHKILLTTLKFFENQTVSSDNYEILIVDNSSDDDTDREIEIFKNISSLDVGYFKIEEPSASKARNLGILNAKYDLILSADDDIIATNNLLEEHIKFHQHFGLSNNIAVLGYTTWHNSLRVSNFMKFINEYGPQFGYSLIKDETDLPFNFFYSSNISVSKRFLLENGSFDEDFPEYWYDVELGYRLKQKGLKIIFNKNAMAYHAHPTSTFSFLKRQQKVGYYAVLFCMKHHELKDFLFPSKNKKRITKNILSNFNLSRMLYQYLINIFYYKGIKLGFKSF